MLVPALLDRFARTLRPAAARQAALATPTPRALRHLSGAVALIAIAAGLAATAGTARAQSALDIGAPSVLSQQGQRLKIAVPYGSAPGERVTVLRFSVASVSANGGAPAPDAEAFVVSQPERRNVIYLQSRELVSAASLKLVLAVTGPAPQQVTMNLQVPPPKAAPVEADPINDAARPAARSTGTALRSKAKRRAPAASAA